MIQNLVKLIFIRRIILPFTIEISRSLMVTLWISVRNRVFVYFCDYIWNLIFVDISSRSNLYLKYYWLLGMYHMVYLNKVFENLANKWWGESRSPKEKLKMEDVRHLVTQKFIVEKMKTLWLKYMAIERWWYESWEINRLVLMVSRHSNKKFSCLYHSNEKVMYFLELKW